MYFQELSRLRDSNRSQTDVLKRIDSYLAKASANARFYITATDVAQAIAAPRQVVIGLLMAAAHVGVLRLKFRLTCPERGAGIRDYDELSEIPLDVYCDLCDQTHRVSSDDIEYFFEIAQKPMANAG